jgi:hypothetical protein
MDESNLTPLAEQPADSTPDSIGRTSDKADRQELPTTIESSTPVATLSYLFRGDAGYAGGPVGLPLDSPEARAADIQDPADHVLRKASARTSIFVSFTTKLAVADRFGGDRRSVLKVAVVALQQLESAGTIRMWTPEATWASLRQAGKKAAKHATATRDAMRRNAEVLIEGQIPEDVIHPTR